MEWWGLCMRLISGENFLYIYSSPGTILDHYILESLLLRSLSKYYYQITMKCQVGNMILPSLVPEVLAQLPVTCSTVKAVLEQYYANLLHED